MRTRPGLVSRLGRVSSLADDVLPLIRTRSDIHRWSASNSHGRQMHEAIDILEAATSTHDPVEVHKVTHKALASALKVIARADDSSGIIGDACQRLLGLHPQTAAAARVSPTKLADWMIDFHFGKNDVDYFELDPVAYAPALGDTGMAVFRSKLHDVAKGLGPEPSRSERWNSEHSHEWFVLEHLAQRLAVHDRDIEAIIRTHVGDRAVAAWFTDTAKAFEEIGEFDLAIDWAKQATDFGPGHQSQAGGEHWCRLLQEHHPDEVLEARLELFRRWPSASMAARLHDASGPAWSEHRDNVLATLAARPDDAVRFVLSTLKDPEHAWRLAHDLALTSGHTWSDLLSAYEHIDPLATLPIHTELVESELLNAGAEHYRLAAKRLKHMRSLAAGTSAAPSLDDLIARLREEHRRRPRLQQEFTRAGLP